MFACISRHGIMLDGAVFHFPILAEDIVQDLLGDVDTILNLIKSQRHGKLVTSKVYFIAMYVPNGKRNSQEL